ncbi:hypothetical protein Tco_1398134 [Tanacetum coccineum]
MMKPILNERMEKVQKRSSLAKPITNDEMNIKLSEEFLMKLRSNAYYRTFDEDVVDHIAKVFPLSLADDARQWWIDEGDGKITTWKELVEKFFYKFYPLSHNGEDELLEEESGWNDTKSIIHSWINENWNNELMNDIVSSDEEWEESDYGNPPNTTTDSSFKPCLNTQEKDDIKKKDERSQMKRKGNNNTLNKAPKSDNQNNEQHSKRVLKSEKFEAIKYSLGPNK